MNLINHTLIAILFCSALDAHVRAGVTNDDSKPATYTQAEVRAYLKIRQGQEKGRVDWSFQAFKAVNHDKNVYSADDVNSWEGFTRPAPPDIHSLRPEGIKIRSSFDDVVSSEDPTVATLGTAKSGVSDLTGASFSYTHDYRANSDAWAAKGALLLPFSAQRDVSNSKTSQMVLQNYGFVPSVSFDRETNDKDKTKEIDSLIFRAGLYAKWLGPEPLLTSLTFRAYATYGTDFEFESKTPAAEFELEPVIGGKGAVGIGSRHFVAPADSKSIEKFSITNVAYQLRAMLHGYYGRTTNAGHMASVPVEDFLRLGPKLQLRLDPLFTKQLTCDINYEYQGDVIGQSQNHGLLSIEPEYVINSPPPGAETLDKPLIKLHASYQDGGVDLTKEKVHTFLIGLGVTY